MHSAIARKKLTKVFLKKLKSCFENKFSLNLILRNKLLTPLPNPHKRQGQLFRLTLFSVGKWNIIECLKMPI